jgi:tetratricopeptide (TPR) repeat protein
MLAAQGGTRNLASDPVGTATPRLPVTVRAVVVGISTYEYVRPLHFAARDAESFAGWLSKAGVADTNIRFLTDSTAPRATAEEMFNAIMWLKTTSIQAQRAGHSDNVAIIYFAGHGDVEDTTGDPFGYLLGYSVLANGEKHPNNYSVGGGIAIADLRRYVQSMAAAHVRVLVITDACRDGQLSSARQAQLTLAQLSDIQEFSIMMTSTSSSAPTKLSEESADWGGGHGVYTWYLLDALQHPAKADRDHDGQVTLKELSDYAYDSVRTATHGQQLPDIGGDKEYVLPLRGLMAASPTQAGGGAKAATPRTYRPSTVRLPAPADSAVAALLDSLSGAVSHGHLIGDEHAAWDLYQRLVKLPASEPHLAEVRRGLQAVFERTANVPIQVYLGDGNGNTLPRGAQFHVAADEMAHAADLLDADDPHRQSVEARQLFLDAFAIVRENRQDAYPGAERALRASIQLDPRAAYAHNALGAVYLRREQYDSATAMFGRAIQRAPNWVLPRANLGAALSSAGANAQALVVLRRALAIDSTSVDAAAALGATYVALGRYRDAETTYRRAKANAGGRADPYLKLASLYREEGRLPEAAAQLDTAADLAARDTSAPFNQWVAIQRALVASAAHHLDTARLVLQQAIAQAPYTPQPLDYLGDVLVAAGLQDSAETLYRKADELEPQFVWSASSLADLLARQGRAVEAEALLRSTMRRAPGSVAAIDNLGIYEAQHGRLDIADSAFRAAIARDTLFIDGYNHLAEVLRRQQKYAAVDSVLRRAIQLEDSSALAPYHLGAFYYLRARADTGTANASARSALTDSARAEYARVLAIDPTHAGALEGIAQIVLERGRIDSAVALLRQAAAGGSAHTAADYASLLSGAMHTFDERGHADTALMAANAAVAFDSTNVAATRARPRLAYLAGNPTALHLADRQRATATTAADSDAASSLMARALLDAGRAAEAHRIMIAVARNTHLPVDDLLLAVSADMVRAPAAYVTAARAGAATAIANDTFSAHGRLLLDLFRQRQSSPPR